MRTTAAVAMISLTLTLALALAWAASSGCAPAARSASEPEAAGRPEAPVNAWVMRHPAGPNNTWENGIAYDPATRRIVFYGGHAWGYPQSNYTHLYDLAANRWSDSRASLRPQRRCLVMLNYLDSAGRMVCTQGGSAHGSMPVGGFAGEYRKVFRSDPRGPWLYDVKTDRWEDCRTLPPVWKRVAHAQCAYDPASDALVWVAGEQLGLYCPRTNRIVYRGLPEELKGRIAYGIAADPVRGKVVIFGGTGPGGWVWAKGDRSEAYAKFVHNDTWIYDVVADRWTQARPKTVPPRGMPLYDHRFIPMVYHDPSGTILMQQTPLDRNEPDTAKWPATQLWSFDLAAGEWTLVPTENAPPFQGLLAYARAEDLLVLVGGGRDGATRNEETGRESFRPSLSKQLWTCRVRVPGKDGAERPAAARVPRPTVTQTSPDEVELSLSPAAFAPPAEWRVLRSEAAPLPGRFAPVEGAWQGGRFRARVEPGKAYAFRLAAAGGGDPVGPMVSNQPWRPSGLVASVESDKKVVLRWLANREADLAGYRVYRATGAEVEKGEGQLLTAEPVKECLFADGSVDLSDGVARSYWVTAVNRGGVESGASPLAYTFPDPPEGLTAALGADGRSIAVRWEWPKDVKVAGFNVYHVDNHFNTHGEPAEKVKAWFESWKPLSEQPAAGSEAVFTIPAGEEARDHYFYVRAVNVLGQEGFCTDIVSATDKRFRP